ncbi:hypothetical protein BGZ98_006092 [Dissophora globulifera]|nr:hypothetical protein BGZ98_006092 [Dissophora globulifera]
MIYFNNDVIQLHSLPDTQAHCYVDLEIVDPSLVNKVDDTYLIAPPTVWGRGTSRGNFNSVQTPYKVRYSIQLKQALQVGKGLGIWSRIHILDLARFNITLFESALQEPDEGEQPPSSKDLKPLPKNVDEYYFVEDGEFTYGEVAQEIAKALKVHGIIDSGEVTSVDAVNDLKYFEEMAGLIFSGNSSLRAIRARQILGWKPEHTNLKDCIADKVKRQLQNQK